MNMNLFKKLNFLQSSLIFNVILVSSTPHHNQTNYCENIRTQQTPFLNSNSSSTPSLLANITLCRSQNLYFRTSLGLFHVSSVDYNVRLLTITHSSCSSSLQYVSPLEITAGFPSPPEPNSLILFNCLSRSEPISPFMQDLCRDLYTCGDAASSSSKTQDHEKEKHPYSCLVVEDLRKVEKDFHPKHWNCSHYSWVHRNSSDGGDDERYKVGMRITFDIPASDICKGCENSNGSCGAGLKCLCHPKECNKVISKTGSIKLTGGVFYSLLFSFIGSAALFMHV
ncbi:uncharacterized protein LOC130747155 isoform X2 [Lotus japonicus]|uniref:uncharacterized protein LOC130747155 isoform X2 n=1 Tax=Lotus japonicus TaxID=34305 RepID=UPI00258D0C65|nr:uncharacterized protein LOC130747155 isoform X2 [Lotus japonicus]